MTFAGEAALESFPRSPEKVRASIVITQKRHPTIGYR